MTNGSDDQLCSVEHIPVAEQGEVSGRQVAVESGSDSASSTSVSDPEGASIEAAREWNSYIDSQIRKSWPDLGHDEQAFCDEYLENGYNHREAAAIINRPQSTGIRLLNKPLCREYIVYAEDKRRSRSIITERFLEAQYFQLLDQANGDEEVPIVTGSGAQLNARKFDGNLKLSVLKEMGVVSGVTKPDAAALGAVTVVIDMGALTGADHKVVSEQ